jgi:diguanylate cyclase (GGDEF)-like protein/PAS domain S-box-containing protein
MPLRYSLKTRVTLSTLAIFLASIWTLAFYVSTTLRDDMQRLLGEQQYSIASLLATEINDDLERKLSSLRMLAIGISPELLRNPMALQAHLENYAVVSDLFNGGVLVTRLDGVAIADVPRTAGRLGVSYLDQDAVAIPLREGRDVIGKPTMGKKLLAPSSASPCRFAIQQGKGGVLAGVVNLAQRNFLDKVAQGHYGKTGAYLVGAPQHKLFVTSSDKSRAMRAMPVAGTNPLHDRFASGFEGYGVLVNFRGEEELAAAKGIPLAGWYMAVAVPTAEAFGPIRALQDRMLFATLLLSLLAAGLTYWMLKRQLLPLQRTVSTLAGLSTDNAMLQPLPVTGPHEIRQLIREFNRLIDAVIVRQGKLRKSEASKESVFNSVISELAIVDRNGVILAVNEAWRRFAIDNAAEPGKRAEGVGPGANYLDVCRAAGADATDEMQAASAGIQSVIDGVASSFILDYPCHSPSQLRWFAMFVTPFGDATEGGVVISHTDITERKLAEQRLEETLVRAEEGARVLQALMEHIPIGITIADAPDVAIRMVSRHGRALTGQTPDTYQGLTCADHVGQWDLYCADGVTPARGDDLPLSRATKRGEMVTDEEWYIGGASGGRIPILCSASPIRDAAGHITGAIGVWRDISVDKAQQAQRVLTSRIFAQSREGIVVTDSQRNMTMVNAAFTDITGYSESEARGRSLRSIGSTRHSQRFYEDQWSIINTEGRWAREVWGRRKNGEEFPAWMAMSALRDGQGQVTHYIGSFSDLSNAKAAESRIQWLSHFDTVTGLPNRTLLKDRTTQSISMVQRSGEPLSLLMVGFDQFKRMTDTYGPQTSDNLLSEMGRRLSAAVRAQDTVARMGDKEFVLLLPGTPTTGAAHLAGELLTKLALPYRSGGEELPLTASIGIASYPDHGADFDALTRAVQLALDRAQAQSRNSSAVYDGDMYQQMVQRDALVQALHKAIGLSQFQLWYQPFVSLRSGKVSGSEALLRWHHPTLGMVSPAEFIPLAEESGLIKDIGAWVLRQACRDIRGWLDQGVAVPHVAVNVSPLQFRDADLVGHVSAALTEFGIDPTLLYLEVTEGALMNDVVHSETMLQEFKALGVKLSLDDFGTGYSSLSYLKRFPFDKVKIDQSFIRDVTTCQSDDVIVKVIVSMAHGLGLTVIAEGVETEAQCEIMRTNICDEIQGYLFSRPVPAPVLLELLEEGRQLPAHLLQVQKPRSTVLLVDDEPHILTALKRLFRRDGHVLLTAGSGAEGLEILANHKVDVIISDQRMPGMTGVEFLRAAKVHYPDTIRIVLSGYTELQSVTDAINEGAIYRFLTKPWDDDQLREHVQKALEFKGLLEENRQLDIQIRTSNQELVAANRQLGQVLQTTQAQIRRDAATLSIAGAAWNHVSLPMIAVDDAGLITFINPAAEQLLSCTAPVLGEDLASRLPALHALLAVGDEGVPGRLLVDGQAYCANWHRIRDAARSCGRIATLTRMDVRP